jgi:hypothetical protein
MAFTGICAIALAVLAALVAHGAAAPVWTIVAIGSSFVAVGSAVTMWVDGWRPRIPHLAVAAKVVISVIAAIVLAPALGVILLFGMLTLLPPLVVYPFVYTLRPAAR